MRRADLFATTIGVGLALVLMVLAVATSPPVITTGLPTPLAKALWMHSGTSTSSGTEQSYTFSLTVNQTIPLNVLQFGLYLLSGAPISLPPTVNLSVLKAGIPIAQYNFTTHGWTSGGSDYLVGGDWLEVQIENHSLLGDVLVALGGGGFSSVSSVPFP